MLVVNSTRVLWRSVWGIEGPPQARTRPLTPGNTQQKTPFFIALVICMSKMDFGTVYKIDVWSRSYYVLYKFAQTLFCLIQRGGKKGIMASPNLCSHISYKVKVGMALRSRNALCRHIVDQRNVWYLRRGRKACFWILQAPPTDGNIRAIQNPPTQNSGTRRYIVKNLEILSNHLAL